MIKDIRSQFSKAKGYLDSASTSLTPAVVIDAMDRYYRDYRANVHRGIYKESECATREFEVARKSIAALIGARSEEVIFTPGATWSSNMLIRSLEDGGFFASGNVVSSALEHHANFVPLREAALRHSITFRVATAHAIEESAIALIDQETRVVALTLASNVTGQIVDVKRIAEKKNNAIMIVDATAALGHIPVDVHSLGADAVYFSGHKMFGPTGIGVLWVRKELLERLPPSIFGGNMIAEVSADRVEWAGIPERFEAGTPNISGAIGMGKAAEYITLIGFSNIHDHIRSLIREGIEKLSAIPGLRVFAAPPENNVGNIAFTVDGVHPHDLAEILSRHEVKVRAGHHCAMPLHQELGVLATIRASFHVYNASEDIDLLVKAIQDAKKIFS